MAEVRSVGHLGQRLAEGVHVVQGVEELVGVGEGDPAPAHHQPEQPAREGVEAIHGLHSEWLETEWITPIILILTTFPSRGCE